MSQNTLNESENTPFIRCHWTVEKCQNGQSDKEDTKKKDSFEELSSTHTLPSSDTKWAEIILLFTVAQCSTPRTVSRSVSFPLISWQVHEYSVRNSTNFVYAVLSENLSKYSQISLPFALISTTIFVFVWRVGLFFWNFDEQIRTNYLRQMKSDKWMILVKRMRLWFEIE